MKEINNFDKLRQFLAKETTFVADNKKSIIWIWVVMRAKDNAEHKERTIKSYHIQSLEDFDYKKDEIIELCCRYHCRAYICVNPKPVLNVLFSLQSIVMENIKNEVNGGSSMLLKGMLDSAVMKSGSNGNKFWIIDVDTFDEDAIARAYNAINNASSNFTGNNIIATIPTAHGMHFITHTFDTRVLTHFDAPTELKKEGLTLLYAYLDY